MPDLDTESSVDLTIQETVEEIEEIIQSLEEGDITIAEAADLRERGEKLIQHLKNKTQLSDGEITRLDSD